MNRNVIRISLSSSFCRKDNFLFDLLFETQNEVIITPARPSYSILSYVSRLVCTCAVRRTRCALNPYKYATPIAVYLAMRHIKAQFIHPRRLMSLLWRTFLNWVNVPTSFI